MSAAVGAPSRLSSAPVNTLSLREEARAELESLLASIPTGKRITIVLDPSLVPVLRLIIAEGSRYLKEHSVDSIVELTPEGIATLPSADAVLYLTRPSVALAQLIATQVRAFNRRGERKHLHVAFVPRRTFVAEQVLKEGGVFADVVLGEWGLDILPLDDDLLTLFGAETCFRDATSRGDASGLFAVSRALLKLQACYGLIPSIKSKGRLAKVVLDTMLRLQREEEAASAPTRGNGGGGGGRGDGGEENDTDDVEEGGAEGDGEMGEGVGGNTTSGGGGGAGAGGGAGGGSNPPVRSEVDVLILLDRGCDLVSPLVSPLTFEALLKEVCGCEYTMTQLDAALVSDPADDAPPKPGSPPPRPRYAPGSKVTVHLNANDKLYRDVRDATIPFANRHLGARAKELQSFRENIRKRNTEMDVASIHNIVKAIPAHQAEAKSLHMLIEVAELLQRHTNEPSFGERWQQERGLLDEEGFKDVSESVSGLLASGAPLFPTLRLLCLSSIIQGGFKRSALEALKKEVACAYGYSALYTLHNLERAGLLSVRDGGVVSTFTGGGSSHWGALSKALSLMSPADMDQGGDEGTPRDINYVTAGYAPLSVRLVQHAITSGWDVLADTIKLVPGGPMIQTGQVRGGAGGARAAVAAAAAAAAGGDAPERRKVVLVCYVGGVTMIEVASLRFLSEKYPVDFLILTTSVIDGTSLLSTFVSDLHADYGDMGSDAALGGMPVSGDGGDEDDEIDAGPPTAATGASNARARAVAAAVAGAGKLREGEAASVAAAVAQQKADQPKKGWFR